MVLRKRWIALLGLVLFAWVLSQANAPQLISVFSGADAFWLLAALAVTFFSVVLKSFKWRLLLQSQGLTVSLSRCIELYCLGVFVGLLTPGRVGDFSRALYLKKEVSFWSAFSSVFLDRLIDVLLLVALGIVSLAGVSIVSNSTVFSWASIASFLALLIALLFLFTQRKAMRKLLKPIVNAFVPAQHHGLLHGGFHAFYDALEKSWKNPKPLGFAVFLGFVSWGLTMLFAYAVMLSIQLPASLYQAVLLVPLLSLAELVPVTVLGLGTREAVSLLFFSLFSIGAESAIAFSLLYLVLGYGLPSLMGLWFFSRKSVSLKSLMGDE